jgi:uncharacterized protein YdaU (DUF1376 family)
MPTKADIWMPLYIGDYLADTSHLDAERHGCYLLWMMHYWRKGPLPACIDDLVTIGKLRSKNASSIAQALLTEFFRISEDGFYHQKRADEEIERWQQKKLSAVERAKKGAAKRWADAPSIPQALLDPCPLPSPLPSTEEQKQKPSRGKPRAKDPNCKTAKAQSRHDEFKKAVKKYWDHKNPGIQMPWDGREGKHLEMFLRAAPQITIAQFRGFLKNRAKSEVNHGERPSQWIDWVTSYSAGPMDKFGKTITNGGTNGASNPSPAKQRVDGARRKLAEIAVERGLLDPADFAQQFGQEVPESGSGGEHRGILQGLRSAGPEILSPEGGEGSGGAPH